MHNHIYLTSASFELSIFFNFLFSPNIGIIRNLLWSVASLTRVFLWERIQELISWAKCNWARSKSKNKKARRAYFYLDPASVEKPMLNELLVYLGAVDALFERFLRQYYLHLNVCGVVSILLNIITTSFYTSYPETNVVVEAWQYMRRKDLVSSYH